MSIAEKRILRLTRHQLYPRGRPINAEILVDRRPIMDRNTPIGSIGSCFAAHIKKFLVNRGFNYVQTSDAPGSQVGSCAWGNVFNTFCVAQEFSRAHGGFNPIEAEWRNGQSGWADPYRKNIHWASKGAALIERRAHAAAVREALAQARVFIITAGLTEIWYSKQDGAVFFQVPPPRIYDPGRHGFKLADAESNAASLRNAIVDLRRLSPDCHVILTVSPVPLRATFRSVNAVSANLESKATLINAVHQVVNPDDGVFYLPSYELVTVLAQNPFKPDNRHVRPSVINQIMQLFMRSFVQ